MAETGPLQIRRDTRENIEGVTPADGELFLATNEADQGTVFSGNGGVLTKSGLSPHDRRDLAGTGGLMPEYDQTSLTLACANSVHVYDTSSNEESGWTVGPANAGHFLSEFIPILQGDLPAGLIADGGWVDMNLSGRLTKPGGTQHYLTTRLMVNDTYMGSPWNLFTQTQGNSPGWGFFGGGTSMGSYDGGSFENYIFYELRLRMQCISPKGVVLETGGDAMFWKLTGEFEIFAGEYIPEYDEAGQTAYDNATGAGFSRDVKLIREFSSVGNPLERLNLRLEVSRPAMGTDLSVPADDNHVHCASMIAYGISPGRQVSRATLGERLV